MAIPSGIRAQKKQAAMALVRDAGLKLIASRVYDDIPVEDIARASGVAPATIYRHFGSKGRIFAWPLFDLFPIDHLESLLADDDLPVALLRLAGQFDAGDPESRLTRLRHLRLVLSGPALRHQFDSDLSVWASDLAGLLAAGSRKPDIAARAAAGAAAAALGMALQDWAAQNGEAALLDLIEIACSGIESHFQY